MLSYVQIWFFAYCWIGPVPIKSLRAVRVFYLLYGLACLVWWGGYGTTQAVAATRSGFQSCLSTSPTLYIMAQYEVAVFWLLLLVFVGFVVNERTAKLRQEKLHQWARRGTKFQKPTLNSDENEHDKAARTNVLADATEKAREAEEQQRSKLQEAQDHLYGDGDESDPEADAVFRDHHADEEKDGEEDDDVDDDEEDDELLLGLEGHDATLMQQDKSHQD